MTALLDDLGGIRRVALEQLQVQGQGVERISDLVGNARGEVTDRVEGAALKLFLRPFLLGCHVADVDERPVLDGNRLELQRARFRVGDRDLALRGLAIGQVELGKGVGRFHAQQRLGRRIRLLNRPRLVDEDDAERDGAEQRVEGGGLARQELVLLAKLIRVELADVSSDSLEIVLQLAAP